ncbi:RagB/SusD family nutrient uptake outer membrane protein [Pedobacter immunditicola]|uniref:RagB/SusD family nutrient uptake outer membrane protein n=1 Tax=Pedobacter immunditicola TaxID=3133440 RepID=UPI0030B303A8
MNIKHTYLLLFFIVLTASSCKKSFLELAPASNANAEIFYKTKADMELAVNAAYSTLYTIYDPEGPVSYTSEMMGDNTTLYIIAGNQTDKFAFKDYNVKTNNTLVYSFWKSYYAALYSINIVISKLEASDLNATEKENVKAQMLFLRGLYYFNMVRHWGEIPIVTTPLTVEETYQVLRSPQEDVYKLIIDDLKYAAEKLPASVVGRASQAAALTALGEVYLTRNDKENAKTALNAVYQSNLYKLQSSYSAVFGPNVKNTQESIFEIQHLGGASSVSTNTYSKYYRFYSPNVNLFGFGGIGMNQVTDDLYNEYESGDPRREVSIALGFQNGAVFQEQKYPIKWVDLTATKVDNTVLANNNFMIYRYADVLLMLSEATGDPIYLNAVRARAGLPLFGTAAYPSAKYPTLELALEHERRVELAIEFHRWFDLKRTGRAVQVLTAKGKPVTAEKLLLPIPEIVRLQNSNITQNPGY